MSRRITNTLRITEVQRELTGQARYINSGALPVATVFARDSVGAVSSAWRTPTGSSFAEHIQNNRKEHAEQIRLTPVGKDRNPSDAIACLQDWLTDYLQQQNIVVTDQHKKQIANIAKFHLQDAPAIPFKLTILKNFSQTFTALEKFLQDNRRGIIINPDQNEYEISFDATRDVFVYRSKITMEIIDTSHSIYLSQATIELIPTDNGFVFSSLEYENSRLAELLNCDDPDREYQKQFNLLKHAILEHWEKYQNDDVYADIDKTQHLQLLVNFVEYNHKHGLAMDLRGINDIQFYMNLLDNLPQYVCGVLLDQAQVDIILAQDDQKKWGDILKRTKDFSNKNLSGVDLSGKNLSDADLSGITVDNRTKLKNARLENITCNSLVWNVVDTRKGAGDKLLSSLTISNPKEFLDEFKKQLEDLDKNDPFLKELALFAKKYGSGAAILFIKQHIETHSNTNVEVAANRTYYKFYKTQEYEKETQFSRRASADDVLVATSQPSQRKPRTETPGDYNFDDERPVSPIQAATAVPPLPQQPQSQPTQIAELKSVCDFLGLEDAELAAAKTRLPAQPTERNWVAFTHDEVEKLKSILIEAQYQKDNTGNISKTKRLESLFDQNAPGGIRTENLWVKSGDRETQDFSNLPEKAKTACNQPVLDAAKKCLELASQFGNFSIGLMTTKNIKINFDINTRGVFSEENGETYLTVTTASVLEQLGTNLSIDLPEIKFKFKFQDPDFILVENPEGGCADPLFKSVITGAVQVTQETFPAILYQVAKASILATQETNQKKFELLRKLAATLNLDTALDLTGVDLTGVDLTGINALVITGATVDAQDIARIKNKPDVSYDTKQPFTCLTGNFAIRIAPDELLYAENLGQTLYDTRKAQIKVALQFATPDDQKRKYVEELLALSQHLKVTFDLSGLNLSHADLMDLDLRGISLRGAILDHADLTGAIIDDNTDLSKISARNLKCNRLFYEIPGVALLEITDFKTFWENFEKNYSNLIPENAFKNSPFLKSIENAKGATDAQKFLMLQIALQQYPKEKYPEHEEMRRAFLQTYYQTFKVNNSPLDEVSIAQCRQICEHANFEDPSLVLQRSPVAAASTIMPAPSALPQNIGVFSQDELNHIQKTEVEKTRGEGINQMILDADRGIYPTLTRAVLQYIQKHHTEFLKIARRDVSADIDTSSVTTLNELKVALQLYFVSQDSSTSERRDKLLRAEEKVWEPLKNLFIAALSEDLHLSDAAKKDLEDFLLGCNQMYFGLTHFLLPKTAQSLFLKNLAGEQTDTTNQIIFRNKQYSKKDQKEGKRSSFGDFQYDAQQQDLTFQCKTEYEIGVTIDSENFIVAIDPVNFQFHIQNKKYHLTQMDCKSAWFKPLLTCCAPISEEEFRELIYRAIKNHLMSDSSRTPQKKVELLIKIAEKMNVKKDLSGVDLSGVDLSGVNITSATLDKNNIAHLAKASDVIFDAKTPFTYLIDVGAGKQIALQVAPEDLWKKIKEIAAHDSNPEINKYLASVGGKTVSQKVLDMLANDGTALTAARNQAMYHFYKAQAMRSLYDVKDPESRKLILQSLADFARKYNVNFDLSGVGVSKGKLTADELNAIDLQGVTITGAQFKELCERGKTNFKGVIVVGEIAEITLSDPTKKIDLAGADLSKAKFKKFETYHQIEIGTLANAILSSEMVAHFAADKTLLDKLETAETRKFKAVRFDYPQVTTSGSRKKDLDYTATQNAVFAGQADYCVVHDKELDGAEFKRIYAALAAGNTLAFPRKEMDAGKSPSTSAPTDLILELEKLRSQYAEKTDKKSQDIYNNLLYLIRFCKWVEARGGVDKITAKMVDDAVATTKSTSRFFSSKKGPLADIKPEYVAAFKNALSSAAEAARQNLPSDVFQSNSPTSQNIR